MNAHSIFDLSSAEKLQLVEDLWDDLAAKPDDVPVQDWQKDELERRKANLQMQQSPLATWEDVKARIRERHGK